MAEERLKCRVILVKGAEASGKKIDGFCGNRTVELFRAVQWRWRHRPHKRDTWPSPPIRYSDEYWSGRYRVRLDGKWYNPGKSKYSFLTMGDIMRLVEQLAA